MSTIEKYSPKREAVLDCLRSTRAHPTADWLYDRLRQSGQAVSRATVYRNLARFRAEGQVVSVATVGGFERFDANIRPHPHFVCRSCGAVLDVDGLTLPQELCAQAAARLGAKVDGAWVTFSGVCADCSEK